MLKNNPPTIVVATPGRLLALVRTHSIDFKNLKHFVIDECDKVLKEIGKELIMTIGRYESRRAKDL